MTFPRNAQPDARAIDIEPVWSGHRVNFALLTHERHQFVAYYDAQRCMSIAQRTLDRDEWSITRLPRVTGWDSHNYVTMAIDRRGHLHVAGDMHCVPMCYFRSTRPLDASSFERIEYMVGPEREQKATYPLFLRNTRGALIFRYRDGMSGNGDDLYNIYDEAAGRWRRLMDEPLTAGLGRMNAYCIAPKLGPDGRFHIVWIWRDTGDCNTCHDISYARSDDMVAWTDSAGQPLDLPITLEAGEVVDPVPPGGGAINNNVKLGFDRSARPVVTYHKCDAAGNTQIYAARREADGWRVVQVSDWTNYRWAFEGFGSIRFEMTLSEVQPVDGGGLAMTCWRGEQHHAWVLDEQTLKPLANQTPPPSPRQAALAPFLAGESDYPGMARRTAPDLGDADGRFVLVWETLDNNRDKPRPEPWPAPAMLRVIDLGA